MEITASATGLPGLSLRTSLNGQTRQTHEGKALQLRQYDAGSMQASLVESGLIEGQLVIRSGLICRLQHEQPV